LLGVIVDFVLVVFDFMRCSRRIARWSLVEVPLLMVPVPIVPLFMVPLLIVPVLGVVVVPVPIVPVVPVVVPVVPVVVPVVPGVVWAKAALVQRAKAAARKMLETFMKKGKSVNKLVLELRLVRITQHGLLRDLQYFFIIFYKLGTNAFTICSC